MNADIKFRNLLVGTSIDDDNFMIKVMSAECEVFIWRDGNQYAVTLNMRQEVKQEEYTDEMEKKFWAEIQLRAQQIDENWKLVDINTEEKFGKVVGQRQVTFYEIDKNLER
jgi:hypothetical protein